MHNWLTWLAFLATLPATIFFASAGYTVWRGKVVVLNRNGTKKTPLRYALWTAFCGATAVLLLWEAATGM